MLVFEERGKPEYPEKNLSKQGRDPTTNSAHVCRRVRESNPTKTVAPLFFGYHRFKSAEIFNGPTLFICPLVKNRLYIILLCLYSPSTSVGICKAFPNRMLGFEPEGSSFKTPKDRERYLKTSEATQTTIIEISMNSAAATTRSTIILRKKRMKTNR